MIRSITGFLSLLRLVILCSNGCGQAPHSVPAPPAEMTLRRLPPSAVRAGAGFGGAGFRPAATNDAVLFDSILDYSYDGNPDLLWGFPTRGYDDANDPLYLNSNPIGADSLISNSPGTRAAQLTLFQVGQPVLISGMTLEGSLLDADGYFNSGSIAIIFFDGVYDAPGGLPFTGSGAGLTQKMAQTANGTNGYIIKFPNPAVQDDFYTVAFGTTGPSGNLSLSQMGMQQPMRITDPQGRFGVMVAAIPDSARTSGNVWQYQKGAPNGLNRAYLYQNYNFTAAAKANTSGGGYASTLKPAATGTVTTSSLIPGGAAFAALPGSDLNAGKITPGTGTAPPASPSLPLNPFMTFYGSKLNGAAFATGELRGRVRNLGFDPDSAASNTFVSQSGASVPGERRPNRYRFTFITPPVDMTQHTVAEFWTSAILPPGFSIAFQQEFYAQASYGENNDGANAVPIRANTPLRLNYRLRGIPTGNYSLLAQQIPVYGTMSAAGGGKTLLQDSVTATSDYPGADHVAAFFPLVTIPSSTNLSTQIGVGLFPDNYSNPVTLDMKLRLQADMGGGANGAPDGVVDSSDFALLIADFGGAALPGADPADIGGGLYGAPDGFVDSSDFGILIGWYAGADQVSESAEY